jgi:hypothetical protein
MKQQNLRLYSLAQEWATLRQASATEKDYDKRMAIVDRLTALVSEAERLLGFKDEACSQKADPMSSFLASEKSGASD